MRPEVETFTSSRPEIDPRLIREHLDRLGDLYFEAFDEQEVYRHLFLLARLTPQNPVELVLRMREEGLVECTVLAFDYPSEFSLITGTLSGMGMDILSGDVFTYRRVSKTATPGPSGHRGESGSAGVLGPWQRRLIIDRFTGTLDTVLPFEVWADELRKEMGRLLGLLEKGEEGAVSEAKQRVNEMVVRRLTRLQHDSRPVLYPVHMDIDNASASWTRLKVISVDTPAFLYALSTALSLHDILIEHMRIRTQGGRIEDRLDLVDAGGRKIEDEDMLDRLKISVLLTKQFTYFLGKAPDPYTALFRFEHLLREVFQKPAQKGWMEVLTHPEALKSLARILGASDFLWEDFIRLQHETLLPMLRTVAGGRPFCESPESLARRIREALHGARTLEEEQDRLNEFKDREIYLMDLDYILNPEGGFQGFAEKLTLLAEHVVATASEIVYRHLVERYGSPKTIGGLETRFAVLGLGKLGGAALGYASDMELLFVYSDSGRTEGNPSLDNSEFFDHLVKGVLRSIRAKREGIFQVDLRLRPFGNAGPLATSLETFCGYYGPGGRAHAYERLALVRMRAIAGDEALGQRLERLRDEMLYFTHAMDFGQLKDLREKQFKEKTGGSRLNAKFSPGGLVDLEYGVQLLQVIHGGSFPELRTPRIHQALCALQDAKIMSQGETSRLIQAYDFLRHLINGLRMLRGSAQDLFLPPQDSEEFLHLARRMGYERGGPLGPAENLRMDFETHTAVVRVFAERYFGRDALPGEDAGTVVDLVLSDDPDQEVRVQVLHKAGFKDPERAFRNLQAMAGIGSRRDTFARLALLAFDHLERVPDCDMALNNWERFIRSLGSPEFHYNLLLSQPMRLEILLGIFSGSQFLADTLIRNPEFLDWVMIPHVLRGARTREEMAQELRQASRNSRSRLEWLNRLRRFRRREMLRVGTRDMCLRVSPQDIVQDLSSLAEVIVQAALEKVWEDLRDGGKLSGFGEDPECCFCVLAMGKLGGKELNYSSDIDLVGMWDERGYLSGPEQGWNHDPGGLFARVMEALRSDLSSHTEEGYAYRVDLRLRPFGRSGELVPSFSALRRYYEEKASLWEVQAALKTRALAGNLVLAHHFLEGLRPVLLRQHLREAVVDSIERMRNEALKAFRKPGAPLDIKSGVGGLRDVEFMVQGLQLIHAPGNPALLEGNTLAALDLLGEARLLPSSSVEELKRDYLFLRRVEHYLQIMEDRQIHALPKDPAEVDALGKRVMGADTGPEEFMAALTECVTRVRGAYTRYLLKGESL